MRTVDAILNEADKLQPNEKLRLPHQLVDKLLVEPTSEQVNRIDFDKYLGVGKNLWETDAQTYIDEKRSDKRI